MSVVLYALGGFAVMLGAALVGFGIPIKEFGIGNTLIMSGSVVFSAGLVLFGLAAAVSRLTRLTDLMAARTPARDTRAADPFERSPSAAPAASEGRIPFPSRPKPQANVPPVAEVRAPVAPPLPTMPVTTPADEAPAPGHQPAMSPSLAPSLRNPDLGFSDGDEPPAPPKPPAPPVKPASERAAPEPNPPPPPPLPSTVAKPAAPQMPPPPPPRPAPAVRPPQPNYFDTVWSGDAKAEANPAPMPESAQEAEFRPVPRFDTPDAPPPSPPKFEPPKQPQPPKFEAPTVPPAPEPDEPAGEEMHAVAVLKSGVVDGMAYTLYVDGSIEAELPDGTLRFASINALREHLERSG
jgi:hypothetical protein